MELVKGGIQLAKKRYPARRCSRTACGCQPRARHGLLIWVARTLPLILTSACCCMQACDEAAPENWSSAAALLRRCDGFVSAPYASRCLALEAAFHHSKRNCELTPPYRPQPLNASLVFNLPGKKKERHVVCWVWVVGVVGHPASRPETRFSQLQQSESATAKSRGAQGAGQPAGREWF